jgi:type VI secretion system protein ImpA
MTFADLLDSQRLQRAYQESATEYQRLVEAKLTTPEAWRAAITQADPAHLAAMAGKADTCRQQLTALQQVCDQTFPPDAQPGFGKLADLLESLANELRSPAAAAAAEGGADSGGAEAGAGGTARPGVAVPGSLATREDAVRTLQSVVRFLRQTEPHSPVPYMLDRCARWLTMDFDQLMFDLTKDEGFMSGLREKLGIQPPAG